MPGKKRIEVFWYRRWSDRKDLAAVFEIDGEKMKAKWKMKSFKGIAEEGIVVGDKVLRPKDGVAFAEGLEIAFSNSSSFLVVVK